MRNAETRKNVPLPPTTVEKEFSAAPNFTAEDLAALYNYPSIGQLFSTADLHLLDEFRAKITRLYEDLERIVRRGSKEDAEKAARVADAVKITLEFLQTLEQTQNIKIP